MTTYETSIIIKWGFAGGKHRLAKRVYAESEATAYATRLQIATWSLACILQDEFHEFIDNLMETPGVLIDLLSGAIERIEWNEIAKYIMADINFDEEEDKE